MRVTGLPEPLSGDGAPSACDRLGVRRPGPRCPCSLAARPALAVLWAQAELGSRNRVVQEADAILHEASGRIERLLSSIGCSSSGATGSSASRAGGAAPTAGAGAGAARGKRGASAGADATARRSSGGEPGCGSGAGGGAASAAELDELRAWLLNMTARLARCGLQLSSMSAAVLHHAAVCICYASRA